VKSDEGATRLLTQLKLQFDVVQATSNLERYELLILPDGVAIDPALAKRLKSYVKQGGKILASGLTGLTADEAVSFGLINKAVPREELDSATDEWAKKLAAKAPVVMRLGHDSMINQQDLPYFTALEYLHTQFTVALGTEDAIEGAMAFFEKREPNWKGQ